LVFFPIWYSFVRSLASKKCDECFAKIANITAICYKTFNPDRKRKAAIGLMVRDDEPRGQRFKEYTNAPLGYDGQKYPSEPPERMS
jgi:hypothetical protein